MVTNLFTNTNTHTHKKPSRISLWFLIARDIQKHQEFWVVQHQYGETVLLSPITFTKCGKNSPIYRQFDIFTQRLLYSIVRLGLRQRNKIFRNKNEQINNRTSAKHTFNWLTTDEMYFILPLSIGIDTQAPTLYCVVCALYDVHVVGSKTHNNNNTNVLRHADWCYRHNNQKYQQ